MKTLKIIFSVFIFVFAANLSFAQFNTILPIEVGKGPTFITGYYDFLAHDYLLLILSYGYDANFDGIEDPGDEKPAIYKISYTSVVGGSIVAQKLTDLPFASLPFPTRVGLDNSKNTLILPDTNLGVSYYNISTGEKVKTIYPFLNPNSPYEPLDPTKYYISAVSFYNGFLLISIRSDDTGKFYIVEPQSNKIYFETQTEAYPQQAHIQNQKLFILCEGNFNANDSKLMVYNLISMEPNNFEIMFNRDLEVGSIGNHLYPMDSTHILVTMTGSHEIHIINTQTLEIVKTIKLPTSGYNGPRESNIFKNNFILTTAYDGNLYTFDTNGNLIGKTTIDAKLESLFSISYETLNFSVVAVTSPFLQDYSPNNKIFVLINFSNVEDLIVTQDVSIAPNPVRDFCKITLPSDVQSKTIVDIFNSKGEKIESFTLNFAGKELLLPLNALNNGLYFARISSAELIWTIPFVIEH